MPSPGIFVGDVIHRHLLEGHVSSWPISQTAMTKHGPPEEEAPGGGVGAPEGVAGLFAERDGAGVDDEVDDSSGDVEGGVNGFAVGAGDEGEALRLAQTDCPPPLPKKRWPRNHAGSIPGAGLAVRFFSSPLARRYD